MTNPQFSPEAISAKLELARILEADGHGTAEVCRRLQVSELTYLRWYKKYSQLTPSGVTRLLELDEENSRLRSTLRRIERLMAELPPKQGAAEPARPRLRPVEMTASK